MDSIKYTDVWPPTPSRLLIVRLDLVKYVRIQWTEIGALLDTVTCTLISDSTLYLVITLVTREP